MEIMGCVLDKCLVLWKQDQECDFISIDDWEFVRNFGWKLDWYNFDPAILKSTINPTPKHQQKN